MKNKTNTIPTRFAQFTTDEIAAAQINPYKIGDQVHVSGYSDVASYVVIKVTAKTVTIQRNKATLLNGFDSGEPDALTFTPGGFSGHTSGRQRYKIEADPNGSIERVNMKKWPRLVSLTCKDWTRDENGQIKAHSIKPNFGNMKPGECEYYDYNF